VKRSVVVGIIPNHTYEGLEVDAAMFKVDNAFVAGAAIVIVALVALYAYFW